MGVPDQGGFQQWRLVGRQWHPPPGVVGVEESGLRAAADQAAVLEAFRDAKRVGDGGSFNSDEPRGELEL